MDLSTQIKVANRSFVCTKSGFSLVSAAASGKAFLDFLLQNKEIPEYIHLYSPDTSFQSYLEANWPKFKVRRRAQFHNHHKSTYHEYKELLPAGYQTAVAQDLGVKHWKSFLVSTLENVIGISEADFLDNAVGASS